MQRRHYAQHKDAYARVKQRMNTLEIPVTRQLSLMDYHNPFAGTPFRAPPPHLRYLYRIVETDYGVAKDGAFFTLPIPGRPGTFFFTSSHWFKMREHAYYRMVYDEPTHIKFNAGHATSPDIPGTKLYWKRPVSELEVMRTFIASVVRIGPALYDFFEKIMITEEVIVQPEPKEHRIERTYRMIARAAHVYSLIHMDIQNPENYMWDGNRYQMIDWEFARFVPRPGTAPCPSSLLHDKFRFDESLVKPDEKQSPYRNYEITWLATQTMSDTDDDDRDEKEPAPTHPPAEDVFDSDVRARSPPRRRKTVASRKYRMLQKLWRLEGYADEVISQTVPPPVTVEEDAAWD